MNSDARTIDEDFLRETLGDLTGYAHFAFGIGAFSNEHGKYRHGNWLERSIPWPDKADEALSDLNEILAMPGCNDIYFCPNVLSTPTRTKGTAVAHWLLHSDADDRVSDEILDSLGAFAVASGSPGHSHVFVPLNRRVGTREFDVLMRRLRVRLGADPKVSDNDLLRLVGTVNWKGVVLDGLELPYPVEWLRRPRGTRMDPADVAEVLEITLPTADAARSISPAEPAWVGSPESAGRSQQEPFNLELSPGIRTALDKELGDRSGDTYRVVATGFRAGLPLSEIRWAVDRRPDLVERLAGRNDDDVARIYDKLTSENQVGTSERGSLEPADAAQEVGYFERDVARKLHALRVNERARQLFAAEKDPSTTALDAALLREILERPAEPPFRIESIMPYASGMLVVAQRKTGKTTFMLNIARCLVTGELVLGMYPVRPIEGCVAIMNYEVSSHLLASWAKQAGVPADRVVIVNLRGAPNPLANNMSRVELSSFLRSHNVESLIVDPFGRACGASSQNDSGEVSRWLIDLDTFARSEVGATDLILTAHAGWNGERSRGSSALEDWADSIVTLTRDDKDGETRYLRAIGRDVYVEEDRLHYDPATRMLALTGTGSRKQSRRLGKSEALVEPVCDYVRQHPGVSTTELLKAMHELRRAGALDLSFQDQDIRAAIKFLESRGRLRREAEGSGRPTRHYPITPSNANRGSGSSDDPKQSTGGEGRPNGLS